MTINKLANLFPEVTDTIENNEHISLATKYGDISKINYCIFIMPRSGSTYLTHLLRATDRFGYPQEWCNDSSIKPIIGELGAKTFESYMHLLMRKHASPNGVFGIEISYPQLKNANEIADLYNILGNKTKFMYLRRINCVAQAISLYIAECSGVFHSYEITTDTEQKRQSVQYNGEELKKRIEMLINQEHAFEAEFERRSIEPERLYYEKIIDNPIKTLLSFKGLSNDITLSKDINIKKLNKITNENWEEKFREENKAYLNDMKQKRVIIDAPEYLI